MNIKQIKLRNFLSHVDSELDLKEDSPYLFVGENGAGKSSLVKDSITWVLFGEARAKGAGDDLIYNSEKGCKAEVVFDVNNSTYRVVRERERAKKTELSIFRLDNAIFKDISNVTVTKTQEDLEKILGFNYHLFAVSACLEQNSKLNFSELTPKQCKDTIMQILEIDKYNIYEKKVRDKITSLDNEIKVIKDRIEFNTAKSLKYKLSKEKLIELRDKKQLLVIKKTDAENKQLEAKGILENKIKNIEEEIAKSQVRVEELRAIYKIKEFESMGIAQTLQLAGLELNRVQQKILKVQKLGTKCPTCDSELKDTHITTIVDEATKELDAQKQIQNENNPKFKQVQIDLEKIELEGKALKITENQVILKDLNKELIKLLDRKDLNEEFNHEINIIEKEIGKYEQEVLNEEEIKTEIEKDKASVKDISTEETQLIILQQAFGKNGIPAMIISNVTNELEFSINQLLRELTNKNISVKVATEKNLKSTDELSDTLEIIIRNGLLERPYQLYSGGEKYRIDLAIRLAISKILARRNNFKLDTLIIDEPSGLDKLGLINFKETLSRLSQSFKKIFVISHLTEIIEDTKGKFKTIEVKSSNGVSFVKNT